MPRADAFARAFRRAGRMPTWMTTSLEGIECLLFHRTVALYGMRRCFDCGVWRALGQRWPS